MNLEIPSASKLKHLLLQEVVGRYQSVQGTLREAQWHVLCQVANWLEIPDFIHLQQDEIQRNVLSKVLFKNSKTLPQTDNEWTRLLSQWLRQNMLHSSDVKERLICQILAVDGFDGLECTDLKNYLVNVVDPGCIRQEYKLHIIAVRHMYDWFDTHASVASLTGTDSACVVFLALLQLYMYHLPQLMTNEQIAIHAHKAKAWGENFLHRNASYYNDVRKVKFNLLEELSQVYVKAWPHDWRPLAQELLTGLTHKKFYDLPPDDDETKPIRKNKKTTKPTET